MGLYFITCRCDHYSSTPLFPDVRPERDNYIKLLVQIALEHNYKGGKIVMRTIFLVETAVTG